MMKRIKFAAGVLAIALAAVGIHLALTSEHALVTHPKGIIAFSELELIKTNIFLMLIVIVPTFILLFVTAWRYRSKNTKAKYEPEQTFGFLRELTLWGVPSVVIVVMAFITWDKTHELDPRKPILSEAKTLTIQVVAINWKWLFIYPEQGIATVNYVQFPEKTPIRLTLSADDSPMNSFWLPELTGQIYAMSGMVTTLHMMADGIGVYPGRAAEINGEGLADMTFTAKSSSLADFEAWVAHVKQSPLRLTNPVYAELVKRSQNNPVALYSYVEKDLFDRVVMKYKHPG